MNRMTIMKVHVALASLFLPLLLVIPLTGALDLVGVEGGQEKTPAFVIKDEVPESDREEFFREQFRKAGVDYSFEYIRGNGPDFTFRPTTRTHYTASASPTGVAFTKVEPDLLRRLFELHKGHGPKIMKSVEAFFGFALILAMLTGVYLGLTSRGYRKLFLASAGLGLAVLLLAFL